MPIMTEEKNSLLIPLAIVGAGALIGAGIYFSNGGPVRQPQAEKAQNEAAETRMPSNEDLLKNSITLGNPNAPVVMVEYADFQCPFCGRFFKQTRPAIIENYVKSGKVLLVYKDFAFLGPESGSAAEAARCANDQGKFWQYHDTVYNYLWDNYYSQNKNGENVGALAREVLKKFAADLNLNGALFASCLEGGKYKQAVQDETEQGRSFGVSGTPAFFINGKKITGALPYSEFQKVIDEALSNSN